MIRLVCFAALTIGCATAQHGAPTAPMAEQLQQRISQICSELEKGPLLEMPPVLDENALIPPRVVSEAGDECVHAWKQWKLVSLSRKKVTANPNTKGGDQINAATHPEQFNQLLQKLLGNEEAPEVVEIYRFTYGHNSFCGNSGDGFREIQNNALVLSHLRHGRVFDAMQQQIFGRGNPNSQLMKLFGVDHEEVSFGSWIDDKGYGERVFKEGGELTAKLTAQWLEVHWRRYQAIQDERLRTKSYKKEDLPSFPGSSIVSLLRENNGVTDATKERLSKLILTRGQEMVPLENWLFMPSSAAKWMVPMLQAGLKAPKNETRNRASNLLTAANVAHEKPVMRSGPRYRILLNGQPWPADIEVLKHAVPSVSVFSGGGSRGGVEKMEGNVMKLRADDFLGEQSIQKVVLTGVKMYSDRYGMTDPGIPKIYAELPIPRMDALDAEQEVNITLVPVTLSARLPEQRKNDTDGNMEVEFFRDSGGDPGCSGSMYKMLVGAGKPVVLPWVSPDVYWVRFTYPGAMATPYEKVSVGKKPFEFNRQLEFASTLIIPIKREGFNEDQNLELARLVNSGGALFYGAGSFNPAVEILRDGKPFTPLESSIMQAAKKYEKGDSAIFANVPPGNYEIRLRSTLSPNVRTGVKMNATPWMPASVKVIIDENSPTFVETPILTVRRLSDEKQNK